MMMMVSSFSPPSSRLQRRGLMMTSRTTRTTRLLRTSEEEEEEKEKENEDLLLLHSNRNHHHHRHDYVHHDRRTMISRWTRDFAAIIFAAGTTTTSTSSMKQSEMVVANAKMGLIQFPSTMEDAIYRINNKGVGDSVISNSYLMNTYHVMRSGSSIFEYNDDIWSTNPLFLTNRDEFALSDIGQQDVLESCHNAFLSTTTSSTNQQQQQQQPTLVFHSLAASCMDSANIIQRELKLGRDRILPEYTYLDPRGIGVYDMTSMSDMVPVIWSLDHDYGTKDGNGSGSRPPPNVDGTPHETLYDQGIRLRQLISGLETRYTGDNILLIFPDGTGPALLQCLIAGIPLNRVHQMELNHSGEIRMNINDIIQTHHLYNEQQQQHVKEYDAIITRGRQRFKEIQQIQIQQQEEQEEQDLTTAATTTTTTTTRGEQVGTISGSGGVVNLKDKKLEDERIEMEAKMMQNKLEQEKKESKKRVVVVSNTAVDDDGSRTMTFWTGSAIIGIGGAIAPLFFGGGGGGGQQQNNTSDTNVTSSSISDDETDNDKMMMDDEIALRIERIRQSNMNRFAAGKVLGGQTTLAQQQQMSRSISTMFDSMIEDETNKINSSNRRRDDDDDDDEADQLKKKKKSTMEEKRIEVERAMNHYLESDDGGNDWIRSMNEIMMTNDDDDENENDNIDDDVYLNTNTATTETTGTEGLTMLETTTTSTTRRRSSSDDDDDDNNNDVDDNDNYYSTQFSEWN